MSEDAQQGKWWPLLGFKPNPTPSLGKQIDGPSLVVKTQNFCQLLCRQAAGPAQGRGWGLGAVRAKHPLAQSFPGQSHQALPEAPLKQGGSGAAAPATPAWFPQAHPAHPLSTSHPRLGAPGRQLRPEAAPTGSDFRFGLDLAWGLGPARYSQGSRRGRERERGS